MTRIVPGFHVHPATFVADAYRIITIAILIFVALGIPVASLALAHALLQLRTARLAASASRPPAPHSVPGAAAVSASTNWDWAGRVTFGTAPGSPGSGKGSAGRGFAGRRDRGRFTITVERVVDEGSACLELEGFGDGVVRCGEAELEKEDEAEGERKESWRVST